MSVVALASLGFTLINLLATWPASKTQSTVSPPKTVGDLLFVGKQDEGRLQQARADRRRSLCLRNCD